MIRQPIDDAAMAERLSVAIAAARQAGAHLRTLYGDRSALVIEQKGRNDFVSRADREAEALIRKAVSSRFPDDAFVGEETGPHGLADARVVWMVDPLDGTTNFLKGAHNWCVSIGLTAGDQLVGGVIYDPLRDEIFEGLCGRGARLNGTLLQVSSTTRPDEAIVGFGFTERIGAELFTGDLCALLSTSLNSRQLGAGALMLAYTAAGRLDGYYERHMWPWDATAGLALIAAAGGTAAPYPTGADALAGSGVLAANPAIFTRLDTILRARSEPPRFRTA